MNEHKEYRYREGAHGEHCVDYGVFEWVRKDVIARAATKEDAMYIVAELNTATKGRAEPRQS